jgi:hypothetical protein
MLPMLPMLPIKMAGLWVQQAQYQQWDTQRPAILMGNIGNIGNIWQHDDYHLVI